MVRTWLLWGAAVLLGAAVPLRDTMAEHGKAGPRKSHRPVETASRGPSVLTQEQESQDLDSALKDFFRVTGQQSPDEMPRTGERAGGSALRGLVPQSP